MDLNNILIILVALINLTLALLVFVRRRRGKINIAFSLIAFSVVFWCFSMVVFRASETVESSIIWARILYLSATLIPYALVYFAYLFDKGRFSLIVSLKILTALPPLAVIILSLWPGSVIKGVEIIPNVEKNIIFGSGYLFYNFYITGYFIWAFLVLIKKYLRSKGIVRMQVKYIFLGTFIATILGTFTNLILPTFGIFKFNWLGQVLTIIFVGFIAYAIMRYRLMDIRFAMGRGAIYLFSLVSVVGLSFGLLYANNQLDEILPLKIFLPIAIVLAVLIYKLFFRLFEKIASRYFYYTFYSYQAVLTDLGKQLTQILDLKKLSTLIVETLQTTMKLDRTVVLFRNENDAYDIIKNIGFQEDNGISLVKDNFLTKHLAKTKKPLVYEELFLAQRDALSQKEKQNFARLGDNMVKIEANLCLPLFQKQNIIGIIVLGKKISGDPYSQEDIELLIGLSNQASVAFQNAELYGKVQDLSKHLKQKVQEQTKDIVALSNMKSEFLKVVNHQLRTPVSIIKGMASMLYEGKMSKQEQKDYRKKLYLSSERLATILDDILTAQSLAGKREPANLMPCDIIEIIEDQIEHLSPQAKEKGNKIIFKKSKKTMSDVLVDSQMFERIISRLIDNAILYTEKGNVVVSAGAIQQNSKNFFQVSVKDTGLGLTAENKKHIFELFYRGEKAILTHTNGSGLGLFIVKELVKAHQGTITVESAGRGKGSIFTFILPIVQEV